MGPSRLRAHPQNGGGAAVVRARTFQVNLAGPRPLPVYTGVLLVRLTPPTEEQTRQELPGRYEPALPGR